MGHLKSDFLKVLMLLVLFSFTTGVPKPNSRNDSIYDILLRKCLNDMENVFFNLEKGLLDCTKDAIRFISIDKQEITENVMEYLRKMYKLVTAEHIELKEDFCQRLDEGNMQLFFLDNPNSSDCMKYLESFEVRDPIEKKERTSTALLQKMSTEEYELKEKVLYNALYYHKFYYEEGSNNFPRSYGYAYLASIAKRVNLINVSENSITPRKFCFDTHAMKKIYAETSTLS